MPVLKNPKYEKFCQERAKGSTIDEAYVLAGYSRNPGNAGRLNKNEQIRSRIEQIVSESAAKAGVTIERCMEELARIGFSDVRKLAKWRTNSTEVLDDEKKPKVDEDTGEPEMRHFNEVALVSSNELDDDTARAIKSISQTKDGGLKIDFHSKVTAIDMMLKRLGAYREEPAAAVDASTTNIIVTDDQTRAKVMAFLMAKNGRAA